MPRYYIETDDDDVLHVDDEGIELADNGAARKHALEALPDMARDKLPDGDRRTFTVAVRDANGKTIYRATMTLRGDWLEAEAL